MARPPRTDPPVRLEISIPQSLYTELGLRLYSPAEAAIPRGAWSEFFIAAARAALSRLTPKEPNHELHR